MISNSINVTVFNIVALMVFGYGVFEKGASGWWFLAYAGINLLYYAILKGMEDQSLKSAWALKNKPDK